MKNFQARKAFTLFELIIVIAIIIIMVGVAAPMTSSYIVERSLYNAATQVQQDIRLVQHLAITHSTTSKFEIHFDPANNSYTVETSEDGSKIITRNFNDAYGFPEYFNSSLPDSDSIEFGGSSVIPIDLHFDNLGHPDPGVGYINLMNGSGSKIIKIEVSVIGRIHITWVQR
jgi:type II secretory pathway pseudopilin PulG